MRVVGDTIDDHEDRNLLELGRLMVAAALRREESRGAHARRDFPETEEAFARSFLWVHESARATDRVVAEVLT